MNEQIKQLAGILIAVVLATDGLFHAYWATGRIWPAPNQLALVQLVLNSNKKHAFRPAILVPLAIILFIATLMVLARVHLLGLVGQIVPASLLQLGILILAAGFLLRGLAGVVWVLGLGADRRTLFYRVNLMLYTPVCLLLFAAALTVAFA